LAATDRFLINPYRDWATAQNIPIYEGFGLDLLALETQPWDFTKARGALVHLDGRGDYAAIFLHEIPAGGSTRPMQHCFEEVFYVLDGYGSTSVTMANGDVRTFEWGPKSLFSIPLNSPYRIFNGSGRQSAKVASTNDLPVTLKLYHNEEFVFRNPFRFTDREGPKSYFDGGGELQLRSSGNHSWETSFIPDLGKLALQERAARGAESTNIVLLMSDGTMHAHVSEMPVGTYKRAHRHGPDYHVFCVNGEGFSLFWYEGQESDIGRLDWRHGCVFAPADNMFHIHFNKGATPCRYYAAALGSRRYPFNDRKEVMYRGGQPKNMKIDGAQLDYGEQPFRCHIDFLTEMDKNGVKSRMGKYIDETPYLRALEQLKTAGEIGAKV
jgi:mannose-6-phosphate isomerase-like protein (cupin superfamily)